MRAMLNRSFGVLVDHLLCGTLALVHRRHAGRVSSLEAVDRYLSACEAEDRPRHFALPPAMDDLREEAPGVITWQSPALSLGEFPVNGRARAHLFEVRPEAPTVLMLHALMSVSDTGYVRWARRFNALGWNAAFLHLPFHYSRRPRGHLNGELCCTADLVLTGDTVRQAVVEARQLMAWLRMRGSAGIGLLGTSYGGWVGSLLGCLEPDLRFLALLAPMVNPGHALYEGPTSWTLRHHLARARLERALLDRHAHLSSPLHTPPGADITGRTIIVGGVYDRVVRLHDLEALREAWAGSELITVPQGHFGYGMIQRAVTRLSERGLLEPIGPGRTRRSVRRRRLALN